jgi:hypothetical protein
MKIYTGMTTGSKLEKIKELNMGIMISSSPFASPTKDMGDVYCALDNGAFVCYGKGYPFQDDIFINIMKKCYSLGINLDFIVCPDIVCGGLKSLRFSMDWARNKLISVPNLALVVQDGMIPEKIGSYYLDYFSYIFVGGSVDWKWKTVNEWVKFAQDNDKKCHVGQCGQLHYLERCKELGVDSVDSASFTRHGSFDIVEKFINAYQCKLF